MTTLLQIEGLCSGYGRAQVVFDLNLSVERGEVLALIGPNGAGKSTTLKSIMGLIRPWRGHIVFDGQAIEHLAAHDIAQLGLAYVPEERRIFTSLTVSENLQVGRQPSRPGATAWSLERVFDLFPKLAQLRDRLGGQMSGGEQQMLTLARSLMGNPKAILLDEPSEGLAPVIVERIAQAVKSLQQEGLAVLLSEQNRQFAAMLATRTCVLEHGQLRQP